MSRIRTLCLICNCPIEHTYIGLHMVVESYFWSWTDISHTGSLFRLKWTARNVANSFRNDRIYDGSKAAAGQVGSCGSTQVCRRRCQHARLSRTHRSGGLELTWGRCLVCRVSTQTVTSCNIARGTVCDGIKIDTRITHYERLYRNSPTSWRILVFNTLTDNP